LATNINQLHDCLVPRFRELLADQAMIAVEPEVDRARRRRHQEAIAILELVADLDLFSADVLEFAVEFLAGVAFDDGDLLVMETGVGQFPEAGCPPLGFEHAILAVVAHAELLVVAGNRHFVFLAVLDTIGFHADEPAVFPPFLRFDLEGVIEDQKVAKFDVERRGHVADAVVLLDEGHAGRAGFLAVHEDGEFALFRVVRPYGAGRGKQADRYGKIDKDGSASCTHDRAAPDFLLADRIHSSALLVPGLEKYSRIMRMKPRRNGEW